MVDLAYNIPPDEHGAIDGLRLARAMMRSAVDFMLPYVRHCPGCLDVMFSNLANELLQTMHEELKAGQENAMLLTPGLTGADRQAALAAHLAAMHSEVVELLTAGQSEEGGHDHESI